MISTKNISNRVDPNWAFKHLLNLTENLNGQDIKIRSPFSRDRTPSFSIFKKEGGDYKFSCFSTGISGTHIDLFIALQKQKGIELTYRQAVGILKKEFEVFQATGQYVPQSVSAPLNGKGRVTTWELRRWNDDDLGYWDQFNISLPILEYYNVSPVKNFSMEKLVNGEVRKYDFEHSKIFGYHRKDGSLDRLYRPGLKNGKFIKVGGVYTQGSDQIVKPKENLIYIKSLKDVMGFHGLEIDGWDLKAPSSENIPVPKDEVLRDQATYKRILVWMDSDDAGKRASARYKETYNFDFIDLEMGSKDLTDNIRDHGSLLTKIKLLHLL